MVDDQEKNQEVQQEILFKLSMFEQKIRQIQEQLQAVENGILELNILNEGIKNIENSENSEIFAPVGRGIFVKAKLISEELIVDVGNKNLVKKSVSETQKMIKDQILNLEEAKNELNENLLMVGKEAERIVGNVG
tara:strand:- start:59 stop:463 length:405 start_codon:yes stop_codon:yes gene_type:complete